MLQPLLTTDYIELVYWQDSGCGLRNQAGLGLLGIVCFEIARFRLFRRGTWSEIFVILRPFRCVTWACTAVLVVRTGPGTPAGAGALVDLYTGTIIVDEQILVWCERIVVLVYCALRRRNASCTVLKILNISINMTNIIFLASLKDL